MRTYNSKKVTIACGSHIVTGYAEDSFVTIDETGDGGWRSRKECISGP